jgi:hypothetical protein
MTRGAVVLVQDHGVELAMEKHGRFNCAVASSLMLTSLGALLPIAAPASALRMPNDDPKARLLSIDEFPPKPPRMRWARYERLEKLHDRQADKLIAESMRRFGFRV